MIKSIARTSGSGEAWFLWDAAIVAPARRLGCSYQLTEDLQAGQDLGGIVVIDPFASRPEEIIERGDARGLME